MATEYHVATDGSGDFTTIAQVNAFTFQPGDSLLFRKGDIWNNEVLLLDDNNHKGNSSSHFTVSAYGTGVKPIIDGNAIQNFGIYIQHGSGNFYVDISNIEIQNILDTGIKIGDGALGINFYVTLDNLFIHDMGVGIGIVSDNNIITNTTIYNIQVDGIFVEGDNLTIGYCNIYDVDLGNSLGDCIQFSSVRTDCSNAYVHHNTLINPGINKGCIIFQGASSGGIFEYNSLTGGQFGFTGDSIGVIFRNNIITGQSLQAINAKSQDGKYYNNIIYDTYIAFYARDTATGIKIYNNTCYNITYRLLDANTNTDIPEIEFKNNIGIMSPGYNFLLVIGISPIVILSNNIYYQEKNSAYGYQGVNYNSLSAYQTAKNQDLHSIAADPLLNADYTLQAGSPCIDAGVKNLGVDTDYNGVKRRGIPDIGAYEYVHVKPRNCLLRNCHLG